MKSTVIKGIVYTVLAISSTCAWGQDRPDLTVAINAEPKSLDPAEPPTAANFRVTFSIFDTLIKRDWLAELNDRQQGLTLASSLAESWSRIDERTLELKLRKGVTFHDGSDFDADDVACSLSQDRLFGPNALLPGVKGYIGDIETVEAVDPYTVRVRSRRPDGILEQRLASPQAAIIPCEAYKDGVETFKRHPIGTGPAKFESWQDAEGLNFVAFDQYFGGQPKFAHLRYRIVPELAARISGLVSGEYDLISAVTPDQVQALKDFDGIRVLPQPLQNTQEIIFDSRQPGMNSADLRRALSYAIDRDLIVRTIFQGQTYVPNSWQIPEMGAIYDGGRNDIRFDPDAARELLNKAGYDGSTITLRYPSGYYPNGEAVVQAVANMWAKVGVKVRLEAVETIGNVTAGGASGSLISFTYDMPVPEQSICQYRGRSTWSGKLMPAAMEKFYNLCDEISVVSNEKERKRLFSEILDTVSSVTPSALLYQQPQAFAIRDGLSWKPYNHFFMDFRPDVLTVIEAR